MYKVLKWEVKTMDKNVSLKYGEKLKLLASTMLSKQNFKRFNRSN